MRNRKLHKNCKKTPKIKKYHYGDISSQNRKEKSEKETKSKLSFSFVPTRRVIENSKIIAKKFKKLENTIIASFQSKIGGKSLRKRQNQNYRSVSFLLDA